MALQGLQDLLVAKRPSIGTLTLNCSITEVHGESWDISDNPVEDGRVLTDHIQKAPTTVIIEGCISQYPDNIFDQFSQLSDDPKEASLARSKYSSDQKYQTSWAKLLALGKPPYEPFSIYTSLAAYENMVFVNLETIEDSMSALIFTAELREIEEVNIRAEKFVASNLKDRGGSSSKLGDTPSVVFTPSELEVFKFFGISPP